MSTPRHHKPLPRAELDDVVGAPDPAERTAAAHATAATVLRAGREGDPAMTERLVRLADDMGLDELAELWRESGEDTLPATLWQLYLLRTWVGRNRVEASRMFAAGQQVAEVSSVVAGVADPPGPDEVAALGDAILTSCFGGDFAVALERAAAFCRVVAAGRAHLADSLDELAGSAQTRLAAGNVKMAEQLDRAALLWRADRLT